MYGIIEKWDSDARGCWVINYSLIKTHGYKAIRYYDTLKEAQTYAKRETTKAKNGGCETLKYTPKKLSKERFENSKVFFENGKLKPGQFKNGRIIKRFPNGAANLANGASNSDDEDICYIVDF